jgi:hypothetical protein
MSLNIKEFLNHPDELHALVIGLSEVIAFWPPRIANLTSDQKAGLVKEYHYYMLGRSLGVFTWLGLAVVIKEVFF